MANSRIKKSATHKQQCPQCGVAKNQTHRGWCSKPPMMKLPLVAKRRFASLLSGAQKRLANEHGTPAEFAVAVYQAVPSDISMDEAAAAISKYNREWAQASKQTGNNAN